MRGVNNMPEDLIFDESFQDYVLKNEPLSVRKWSRWIQENPEYREDFDKAKEILLSIKFKGYELSGDKFDFDLSRLKEAIRPHEVKMAPVYRSRGLSLQTYVGRIAAAFIILAAATGVFYYLIDTEDTSDAQVVLIEDIIKTSPPGTKTTVTLMDGTKVKLNSESTLEYPEEFGSERTVRLHGEAFFEVARDTLHPFIIYSNGLEVKVLGTSFNVKAYEEDEDIEIAVATGLVTVKEQNSSNKKGILINPMEKAIYSKHNKTIETQGFDEDVVFGWRKGVLVFKNAEFSEIEKELERWYGVEIEVSENLKIQKGYTGKFQNEVLSRVLEGLSFSLDFKYSIEKNKVEIFK